MRVSSATIAAISAACAMRTIGSAKSWNEASSPRAGMISEAMHHPRCGLQETRPEAFGAFVDRRDQHNAAAVEGRSVGHVGAAKRLVVRTIRRRAAMARAIVFAFCA